MFNRSPLIALSILKKRNEVNLFTSLPWDLIKGIGQFIKHPNPDFDQALHNAAFGELDKVKAALDKEPRLIFCAGTVITRSGLTVVGTTLLECALGAGDSEMANMIMPYFAPFDGGEAELERQLARYRPAINALQHQKPYDLTGLIDIIKQASPSDVQAALNKQTTGSALDKALEVFRQAVTLKKITQPQMHYNYQTLIHAFNLYNSEWDNLL